MPTCSRAAVEKFKEAPKALEGLVALLVLVTQSYGGLEPTLREPTQTRGLLGTIGAYEALLNLIGLGMLPFCRLFIHIRLKALQTYNDIHGCFSKLGSFLWRPYNKSPTIWGLHYGLWLLETPTSVREYYTGLGLEGLQKSSFCWRL